MRTFRGPARLNPRAAALAALLLLPPAGPACAQTFSGGTQVNVMTFGSSSTGGSNAANGGDININVTNSNIPYSACASLFISGCVGALSAAGDASGSGNGGNGGQVTIQVQPLTIGTTDPTAQITSYNSGILAESLGGFSTQHPGSPGTGGSVSITSAATIAVNLGNNISPSVTAPEYVMIARQAGVDNYSDFSFGGGILGLSQGAYGVTDNTAGIGGDVTGAAAGAINITDTGNITTGAYTGAGADIPQGLATTNAGIMALSIGGDSAAADQHGWIALGQGGAGGNVTISGPSGTPPAAITTVADLSPGIFALSLGGGGSVAANDIAGGAGGQVTINANFDIAATGNQSSGIVAISTGGNLIGVEQQGISGPGGPVSVNLTGGGGINTAGIFSPAVVAASVAGGLTTSQSQIKDFSTAGGTSGSVSTSNAGLVTATGDGSDGLIAQSIGGGGGTTLADGTSGNYALGSSTSYASGANGVVVQTASSSQIITGTAGDSTGAAPQNATNAPQDGVGIVAQSIGGGGGIVYAPNTGLFINVGSVTSNNNSNGNNGSTVQVVNDGAITTYEAGGDGILAQSIGGGGGNGKGKGFIVRYGTNGGTGGGGNTVYAENGGTIATNGWQASGIIAQSIGGGGGAGGSASGFWSATGGAAGGGGGGGNVTVQNDGSASITVPGDDSYGILAQSIGGGGGVGGKGSAKGLLIAVGVGGKGGSGGNGDAVLVSDYGALVTGSATNLTGAQSDGILAQSIGGGGGSGGAAASDAISALLTVTTSVGGSGGIAGTGGPATVNIGGSNNPGAAITTYGADANGAVAQSIGGGGGAGGQSAAHSLSVFGSIDVPTITVGVGVGGSSGSGSNAGTAQVSLEGTVTTAGPGADGLVAQSVGGGGGLGGDSTALASAALAPTGSISFAVSSAVGGTGGGSGTGGDAVVGLYANPNTTTSIITQGDHAHGIVAQSIGGGGGIGGIGDATAKVPTKTLGLTANIALGGAGGGGGGADTVQVTSLSGIKTAGAAAYGIVAQSIGGGGGLADGGTAGTADATTGSSGDRFAFTLGIGGSGGNGGPGGNVTVNNGALITTTGGSSDGILAQSIGGGGGEGGSSAPDAGSGGNSFLDYVAQVYGIGSAIYTLAKNATLDQVEAFTNYQLAVNVGGSGGAGGNGGQVSVSDVAGSGVNGSINTAGDLANGIVAQSIGGGGGAGGAATTNALTGGYQNFTASLNLSLGGSGGTSGSGGTVGVTHGVQGDNGYSIQTTGTQAIGIVAQSIGGGGGIGGSGGVVGGGTINLGASLTGGGGGSGNGNTVTVDNYGVIQTGGSDSLGILAQSIGGGGGLAATAANTAGSSTTLGYTVTLGGGGGAAGNGGQVNITDTDGDSGRGPAGQITTSGDRAHAIVAQSIGGGGGYASNSSVDGNSYGFRIGAQSSTQNQGGPVNVTLNGNNEFNSNLITTNGNGAYGVIAQSIGGGGGIAGDQTQPLTTGLPGGTQTFSQANGDGGAVTVTLNGGAVVVTNGGNATGVFAQSVGGGGGLINGGAGSAGGSGNGGTVTVTLNNSFAAAENSGDGIFAQSVGSGANAVQVMLNGASLAQGGNGGAGIVISGGTQSGNLINIDNGSVVASYQNNQVAISIQGPSTSMINNGQILGQIVGEGGAGAAVENYGTIAFSGDSNVAYLNNNAGGILRPEGTADFTTGTVTLNPGSQVQIAADFFHQTAAQLNVAQELDLNGGTVTIRPSLLAPQTIRAIITAGALGSGTALAATPDDPVYHYAITGGATGTPSFDVTPSANFTPAGAGLNRNQTSVAKALQTGWDQYLPGAANDSGLAQIFGSLAGAVNGTYPARLSTLMAQAPGTDSAAALGTAQGVMGTLQSCPDFAGPGTLLQEQNCVWERNTGRLTNIASTSSNDSAEASSMLYQLGGQKQVAPGWFLGGTVGLEQNWAQAGGGREKTSATGGAGGLVLKWQNGPLTLSGGIAGGGSNGSSSRVIQLPDVNLVATGAPTTSYLLERLRGSYEFAGKTFYAKPSLNLDLITLNQASYQESGAGAYNLGLGGISKTFFGVSPQVEFGARINATPDLTLHPDLTLGITALSDDTWKTTETLTGQSFAISTPLPSLAGDIAARLDILDRDGLELKLQYGVDITGISLSQTGYLRIGYKF